MQHGQHFSRQPSFHHPAQPAAAPPGDLLPPHVDGQIRAELHDADPPHPAQSGSSRSPTLRLPSGLEPPRAARAAAHEAQIGPGAGPDARAAATSPAVAASKAPPSPHAAHPAKPPPLLRHLAGLRPPTRRPSSLATA
nr:non-classical arabinogalactan protein 31-like [Lolium perenne]